MTFLSIILKKAAFLVISFYQNCISILLPDACRFAPSCSEYAGQAIEKHGIFVGIQMAFIRTLRCHPFSKGGWDPVK